MEKLLLFNVRLCDGVNFFGEPGSILLNRHEIIEVNPECVPDSARRIDGANRLATPGFIDAHGHSDVAILDAKNRSSNSKGLGGFVLEVAGNCGLSAFPLTDLNRSNLAKIYSRYNVKLCWSDFAEYQSQLKSNFCQPEIFPLCGHNTLRSALFGYEKQRLDRDDLRQMQTLLEVQFEQGCPGLSAGLLYSPGRHADDQEMIKLLTSVQKYNRIFALHLRNEGDKLLPSLNETLSWAAKSKLRKLHISHLKASGPDNWSKLDSALELIDSARKAYDMRITFDAYPYSWSMTQLSVSAPEHFLALPDALIMKKLQKSASERQKTLSFLSARPDSYWHNAILVSTALEDFQPYIGKLFSEIAALLSRPAPEIVMEILTRDSVNSMAAFHTMSDRAVKQILLTPECLCGTDETARPISGALGLSHPRNFGSSAKFIRIFMDANRPVSEAIRRLSFDAAQVFGIANYGKLESGFSPKIVLLDTEKIQDNATFASPHKSSDGIELLNLA